MTPPTAAARLLVVDDDDENNRDMISRRLARRGFDVDTAADGFLALDAVAAADAGRAGFDLVLLDIEMPGMSGFDVLRRLRERHAHTRLPVVIATARHDREDVVHAMGLGANDYVTKPLDFAVVLARVEAQLSHKRAVDRIVALEAEVRRHNDELRTPLNAIIGYSEMLTEEATDLGEASMVADLAKINGAGKHLLELINDV